MPGLELFPDRQLINRIKANDRSVLGELYVRFEKLIFGYVTQHGGSDDDAEDMLQEAIVVLWQNVCSGRFEQKAKIGTYLLAVARNKWHSELRKRRKMERDETLEDRADGNPDVLASIQAGESKQLLHRALSKLGAPCKELLMMFYFEERSMADIARVLGFANEDVAKSKKYQCKQALTKLLTCKPA